MPLLSGWGVQPLLDVSRAEVEAFFAQRVENFTATTPILDAGAFQVRHHHRDARMATNAKRLVHRFQDGGKFRAQVRRIDGACFSKRLG